MRVVALVSGGKDSCYNMMQCIAAGHEIVALANIVPHSKDEIDSYMYQSVGHEAVTLMGHAMGLPLYRQDTQGNSLNREQTYEKTDCDEVEDLYTLLDKVKNDMNIEAVASGAILSDYQRIRVENVCSRLGLVSLAYLWQRDQAELLQEMINCRIEAIIVKVAALGLVPSKHLGKSIRQMQIHLLSAKEKYGLNVCGEGGEYETFTLDCPLYTSSIVIEESETVIHSSDDIAPVGYLKFTQMKLVPKLPPLDWSERLRNLTLKDSDGYITDFAEEAIEVQGNSEDSDSLTSFDASSVLDNTEKPEMSPISLKTPAGFFWCGSIVGKGKTVEEGILSAMDQMEAQLEKLDVSAKDVCSVNLFIGSMQDYPTINQVYAKYLNHPNPPTRVCVECRLPTNWHAIVEVFGWQLQKDNSNAQFDKHTIHVQGISHWAPANVGPYSQGTRVGDVFCLAGQIALVPGSMVLVKGGIKQQCSLSLRHVNRMIKALDHNMNLRDVVQGLCYVTNPKHLTQAKKHWEGQTNNAIMDYIVVERLPKDGLVEWHVWAHRHNSQFDYEETGICMDDFSVEIRRRWNYENNVAAIVCHLTYLKPMSEICLDSLTPDLLHKTVEYAVNKLNQDYDPTTDSVCNLKIFVPLAMWSIVAAIYTAMSAVSEKARIVHTVVPVRGLANNATLLSICGIRKP